MRKIVIGGIPLGGISLGGIPLFSALLFISAFAFGQSSFLITPSSTTLSGAIPYQQFMFNNSYRGYIGILSNSNDLDVGSGSGKLNFTTNSAPKMTLDNSGNLGIGTTTPNYNLQIHNPTSATSSILQLTNQTIGSSVTDGLYINENSFNNATILNQENGYLSLGTNNAAILQLAPTQKACLSCLVPAGKFDIWHNTANTATNPHITLKTTVDASNGMIRMENSAGSRYFGQYFSVNSATAANNFVSFDYGGTTPILDMQGNGNVKVSGFTTLGDDVAAPRIKMKKITSTTNAAQGGNVSIPHGVSASKIIAISVLVRYNGSTAEAWVGNGYTGLAGYEFSYQYDGGNIFVVNTPANSANILSKDIKIVVTYEE